MTKVKTHTNTEHSSVAIERIAQRCAIQIRRADVIDHDPEGQRIKALIKAACWESFEEALPKGDGPTVHVTESKDVKFVVHGLSEVGTPSIVGRPAEILYAGLCAVCGTIHDPRKSYDHAPIAEKHKGRKGKEDEKVPAHRSPRTSQ